MWSSRSSILETVLEMVESWPFGNQQKTNLSQGACKKHKKCKKHWSARRAVEGSEPRHFLRPFPPQRAEKLLAATSSSSRKEGWPFLDKAGLGGGKLWFHSPIKV